MVGLFKSNYYYYNSEYFFKIIKKRLKIKIKWMGVIVADVSVVNVPCCEVQKAGEAAPGQCLPNGVVCENRDDYIFFDNFHPTEISYTYTASRAYRAVLQTDASPVDIERLVRL